MVCRAVGWDQSSKHISSFLQIYWDYVFIYIEIGAKSGQANSFIQNNHNIIFLPFGSIYVFSWLCLTLVMYKLIKVIRTKECVSLAAWETARYFIKHLISDCNSLSGLNIHQVRGSNFRELEVLAASQLFCEDNGAMSAPVLPLKIPPTEIFHTLLHPPNIPAISPVINHLNFLLLFLGYIVVLGNWVFWALCDASWRVNILWLYNLIRQSLDNIPNKS